MKNYSYLKGKEVKYIRGDNKEEFKAFVAQIDFEKGLTIQYLDENVSALNDKNHCVCLNKDENDKDSYREDFLEIVKDIEAGIIYSPSAKGEFGGDTMQVCAFE